MLGTHYRQPIDWTVERLVQARSTLSDFAELLHGVEAAAEPHDEFVAALADDLNTPRPCHHPRACQVGPAQPRDGSLLKASLRFLGLYDNESRDDFAVGQLARSVDAAKVDALISDGSPPARPRTSRKPTVSVRSWQQWASL